MIRKYNDRVIKSVKELMAKGYKNQTIKDIIFTKHKLELKTYLLQTIRRCEAYSDVCSHLNNIIMEKSNYLVAIEHNIIEEIKWAIVNDYSDKEIIEVFNVSKKVMTQIKMCYLPYYLIAPQFNSKIQEKYPRKKQNNIDSEMVIEIKKEYVNNLGVINLKDIAQKHKIDKATVSTIINQKAYKTIGSSFNSKINRIKNEQKRLLKQKELTAKRKLAQRDKLKRLREKKNILISEIKEQENILRNAC